MRPSADGPGCRSVTAEQRRPPAATGHPPGGPARRHLWRPGSTRAASPFGTGTRQCRHRDRAAQRGPRSAECRESEGRAGSRVDPRRPAGIFKRHIGRQIVSVDEAPVGRRRRQTRPASESDLGALRARNRSPSRPTGCARSNFCSAVGQAGHFGRPLKEWAEHR